MRSFTSFLAFISLCFIDFYCSSHAFSQYVPILRPSLPRVHVVNSMGYDSLIPISALSKPGIDYPQSEDGSRHSKEHSEKGKIIYHRSKTNARTPEEVPMNGLNRVYSSSSNEPPPKAITHSNRMDPNLTGPSNATAYLQASYPISP